MAEPLRKSPLEENVEEKKTVELEIVPGSSLPGTTPAFDEAQARQMSADPSHLLPEETAEKQESKMEVISNSVKSGLETVTEKSKEVGEKLTEVAGETRDRAKDFALEAGRRAQDLREIAIYRARQARREARRFANERPIEAILAIGGAAFVVGLLLRIWRSNRE
jgi:ElaB/YqjD/DUF883 family membrane-anchored ribosome-binding protein